MKKMNIEQLIIKLNKSIEKLVIKIGDEILDNYDLLRLGKDEIYQQILSQISNIKFGLMKAFSQVFSKEEIMIFFIFTNN
jgi:hypothetical protein